MCWAKWWWPWQSFSSRIETIPWRIGCYEFCSLIDICILLHPSFIPDNVIFYVLTLLQVPYECVSVLLLLFLVKTKQLLHTVNTGCMYLLYDLNYKIKVSVLYEFYLPRCWQEWKPKRKAKLKRSWGDSVEILVFFLS